jgi:hypothetical protein
MSKDEKPSDDRGEIVLVSNPLGPLIEGLREASHGLEEAKDSSRNSVIAAVSAVIDFLLPFQRMTPESWLPPLLILQDALLSLDDGLVHPLLLPVRSPRGGRSRASCAREIIKARAVLTVHWLCESGVEVKEAYKMVANVFDKAGVKAGRGRYPQVTAGTLEYWCKEIAKDVERRSDAAKTYDNQRKSPIVQMIFRATESKDIAARRRGLLKGLRLSLIQLRASEQ